MAQANPTPRRRQRIGERREEKSFTSSLSPFWKSNLLTLLSSLYSLFSLLSSLFFLLSSLFSLLSSLFFLDELLSGLLDETHQVR